ncbi:MAG: Hpt domain-containing protein [Oscillospiraceae bacterium]|nr:Hpt domain-containing protein [Oscillospiraceae bacterium]
MNIKEFYNVIEGDYDDVLRRLMKEDRIVKYVSKFAADSSYDTLLTTLRDKDYPEAFRAAHTLKGISQNLGFSKLFEVSSELAEMLRGGECDDADRAADLSDRVGEEYEKIVSATGMLEAD